jgi:hypothetical protein
MHVRSRISDLRSRSPRCWGAACTFPPIACSARRLCATFMNLMPCNCCARTLLSTFFFAAPQPGVRTSGLARAASGGAPRLTVPAECARSETSCAPEGPSRPRYGIIAMMRSPARVDQSTTLKPRAKARNAPPTMFHSALRRSSTRANVSARRRSASGVDVSRKDSAAERIDARLRYDEVA